MCTLFGAGGQAGADPEIAAEAPDKMPGTADDNNSFSYAGLS